MEVGFISGVLGKNGILKVAQWAKENGFGVIELGSIIPLNEKEFKKAIEQTNIKIISLGYCRNFLSSVKKEREEYINNLWQRIEFASKMGIKYVFTSTGKDENRNLEDNIPLVVKLFTPIMEEARKKGVTILFENCPAFGNIFISPYMWRETLKKYPSFDLKLVYDPSHLIWQGIDCYRPIKEFGKRIVYLHAKDTEIIKEELEDKGILYGAHFGWNIWWRHRLPGWGIINWKKIITLLMEVGFNGVLSIEHEDPVWSENKEKIKASLIMTKHYLESLIPK